MCARANICVRALRLSPMTCPHIRWQCAHLGFPKLPSSQWCVIACIHVDGVVALMCMYTRERMCVKCPRECVHMRECGMGGDERTSDSQNSPQPSGASSPA